MIREGEFKGYAYSRGERVLAACVVVLASRMHSPIHRALQIARACVDNHSARSCDTNYLDGVYECRVKLVFQPAA
jgi:hypothetical protein